MDQAALAATSHVSRNTIVSFEKGQRTPNLNNLRAIRAALEAAGVEFIDGIGPGVRLRAESPMPVQGQWMEEDNKEPGASK
jgi:DNA-binding XRE family transcriptional regulator